MDATAAAGLQMMTPRRRADEPNGYSRDNPVCGAAAVGELLEQHIAEFDQWREDWQAHRAEAKIAMERIEGFEKTLKIIADNITHLSCLPQIQGEMRTMNAGLSSQNTALIGQADKLITPAQKAQGLLYNLLILMVVMAGITLAVVLLRETGHGFKAGPFEMMPRQGATYNDAK